MIVLVEVVLLVLVLKMKKTILLGIVILLAFTLVSSVTYNYQYLGYTKNITESTSTVPIEECFEIDIADTPDSIKAKVVSEAEASLGVNNATSPLTFEIFPEANIICWETSYETTTTSTEIIYTNKSIIDILNNESYDLNKQSWSDNIQLYYCEDRDIYWKCEGFSVYYGLPNGKCLNNEKGNKLCRSGWVLE